MRHVLAGAAAALVAPRIGTAAQTDSHDAAVTASLAALERHDGGRLGVAMLDVATGRRVAHRGNERVLMCSTVKWLLAAAVLARVDRGDERLDRQITFDSEALLEWAPVTRQHVGAPGLSVRELCAAAITHSDNTAANILSESLGGPRAVTGFLRSLGDGITRVDRLEPGCNRPDGDKDTTTPWAMLGSLRRVLLGEVLSAPSRRQLVAWLEANTTGDAALRAGLGTAWQVGDKTGSNASMSNDVAIAWRGGDQPLLITAFHAHQQKSGPARQTVLADVGRIAAAFAGAPR